MTNAFRLNLEVSFRVVARERRALDNLLFSIFFELVTPEKAFLLVPELVRLDDSSRMAENCPGLLVLLSCLGLSFALPIWEPVSAKVSGECE